MKIFETRPGASWYIEESNKIAFLEIQAQISPLECLKVKLPRYRHTVAPTHFQKQVGRGTWLGPNTLALGTSKWGGEPVYNCYGDLDLRLENIWRGIEAELSAPGIDTIQLFAWFNERLFFVEFVFQILNIRNLSRSGGREVWIGANWDPGD